MRSTEPRVRRVSTRSGIRAVSEAAEPTMRRQRLSGGIGDAPEQYGGGRRSRQQHDGGAIQVTSTERA
jgi:hypothetical protein